MRSVRLILRSLNRTRYSRELSALRTASDKQAARHSEQLQARDRKIEELRDAVTNRESTIRTLRESDIPGLECKIELLKAEVELMAELREREMSRIEADIALHNRVQADAETTPERRTEDMTLTTRR